jgi:excisionase family DNA binding protein
MDTDRELLVSDGVLTVPDAANFLSISRSAVYQLMQSGRLPYVHIGRARRIPKRSLIGLAAANLKGGWAQQAT